MELFRRGLNETLDYAFEPGTGDVVYLKDSMETPRRLGDGSNRNAVYFRRFQGFLELDSRRLRCLDALRELAGAKALELGWFLTTAHRDLEDFLATQTTYLARKRELMAFLESSHHRTIPWFDFSSVDVFGGDPRDFLNGAHIGPCNADLLYRRMLVAGGTATRESLVLLDAGSARGC
jgi:hypothetical protein